MLFPDAKRISGPAFTEQELIEPISKERVAVVRDQLLSVTKTAALLGVVSQFGMQMIARPMELSFKNPDGRQQTITRLNVIDQTSSFAADLFSRGVEARDPNSILIDLPDGHGTLLQISTTDRVNPDVFEIRFHYGGLSFRGRLGSEIMPSFSVSTSHREDPQKHISFGVEEDSNLVMTLVQTGRKDKVLEDSLRNVWGRVGILKRTVVMKPQPKFLVDTINQTIDEPLLRILGEINSEISPQELEQLRTELLREGGLTREQFFAQILTNSRLNSSWRAWVARLDNEAAETVTDFARAKVVFPKDIDEPNTAIDLSPSMQHLAGQWLTNIKAYLGEGGNEMDRTTGEILAMQMRDFSIPWIEHGSQLQALLANHIEFTSDQGDKDF